MQSTSAASEPICARERYGLCTLKSLHATSMIASDYDLHDIYHEISQRPTVIIFACMLVLTVLTD